MAPPNWRAGFRIEAGEAAGVRPERRHGDRRRRCKRRAPGSLRHQPHRQPTASPWDHCQRACVPTAPTSPRHDTRGLGRLRPTRSRRAPGPGFRERRHPGHEPGHGRRADQGARRRDARSPTSAPGRAGGTARSSTGAAWRRRTTTTTATSTSPSPRSPARSSSGETRPRGPLARGAAPSFSPGATVTAVLPADGRLVREVQAGAATCRQGGPRVQFGLGAATKVRALVVRYTGRRVARSANVAVDRLVAILQDERDLQVDVEVDGAVLDHDLLTVDPGALDVPDRLACLRAPADMRPRSSRTRSPSARSPSPRTHALPSLGVS